MQKDREIQAREAEEVRQLDLELLHQRAIEAEDQQRREIAEGVHAVEELRGMNTSWSHQRLCDLQRQAARLRHSRLSIPDSTKHYRAMLNKACGTQLTKLQPSNSVSGSDGINIDLSGLGSGRDESLDELQSDVCCETSVCTINEKSRPWRASANDISPHSSAHLVHVPSYPRCDVIREIRCLFKRRSKMKRNDMQNKGAEVCSGKEGSQMSRSESTISRCTPHTPLGPPDSVSVDSNPMPTIYRCRAPIASLDCMDDFSAHSQQMLDQSDVNIVRHMSTYMGNHTTMPSIVTPGLRYKNLGKSGLRVSNIGLGLWNMVNEESTEEVVMSALDSGINVFDLSEAHCAKAEAELGKILKKRNVKRSSIIIITKVYWSTKSDERGLSRKHIIESVKASRARLQLDYIDVVLLHKVDPVCPMEELVRAMNFVIEQGWVMHWGTARWSPSEIMDAYTNCRQFNCCTPIVEQTEYQMFCREKPELYMPELYHRIGVGMMVWSAITTGKGLGRDEVTGLFAKSKFDRKYSTFSWCEEDLAVPEVHKPYTFVPISSDVCSSNTPVQILPSSGSKEQVTVEEPRSYSDKLRDLSNLASTLNCSLSQLAVAWCLKNDNVNCFLLGATNVEQFKENLHALQIVPQLTPLVMIEIERLLANKPQRPPMVSTLAMRNQQNSNSVRVDMTGATSGAGTPKGDEDGEGSSPDKESGRGFCKIQ